MLLGRKKAIPQGLKPTFLAVLSGTAEEAAEKLAFRAAAPEGVID
jgi:hypothetical protein